MNRKARQLLATSKSEPVSLIHDTLGYIESLGDYVVVISCVGNSGSGKSFLLNQILGEDAFEVGTDKPTTNGIWVRYICLPLFVL